MLSLDHSQHPHAVRRPRVPAGVLPPLPLPGERIERSRLVHDQRYGATGAALILLQEIAAALAYVHARGHRPQDIKPANVLIGADWGREAADSWPSPKTKPALRESLQASIYQTEDAEGKAGMGRYVRCRQGTADAPSGGFQKQHMVGTVTYMAPEVLMRRVPSFPADVYAFAILTAETTHRGGALHRGSRAKRRARAHGPGRELQRGGPRQGDRERGVEAVASRGGRGGVLALRRGERRRRRRRCKRVGAIRRDASRARRARLERGPERETHVR